MTPPSSPPPPSTRRGGLLLLAVLLPLSLGVDCFTGAPPAHAVRRCRPRVDSSAPRPPPVRHPLVSSATSSDGDVRAPNDAARARSSVYLNELLTNLEELCDSWIVRGGSETEERIRNLVRLVESSEGFDEESMAAGEGPDPCSQRARRMVARAGFDLDAVDVRRPLVGALRSEGGANVAAGTTNDAAARGAPRRVVNGGKDRSEGGVQLTPNGGGPVRIDSRPTDAEGRERADEAKKRSDWEEFAATNSENWNGSKQFEKLQKFGNDADFAANNLGNPNNRPAYKSREKAPPPPPPPTASRSSRLEALPAEFVAKAGAGSAFTGATLGVGGLDDVLRQIRRRVWIPLAAPPSLLDDLGVRPVRGLLLHGPPGCGKSLLARTLGRILSPARPLTLVSGPEVMERFVGASEENVRALFDEPPALDPAFLTGEPGKDYDLSRSALHVIVLDEFDAIARARGGASGSQTTGGQGDAGVARDSVVNQLLAKMDGVAELPVPTLVVGLTNARALIDPALLRPGRFEVQIEVPPPSTAEQRESILKVHMGRMVERGRVLVQGTPAGSAADRWARSLTTAEMDKIPTYETLRASLAAASEGMTGAELASVCRSAASRALERAVEDFAGGTGGVDGTGGTSVEDCLLTEDDLRKAVEEVRAGKQPEEEKKEKD